MEIDVSKCPYKGGLECHIRDYPIEYCADIKIEDCPYKQLQCYKQVVKEIKDIAENGAYDEFNIPLDECSVILQIIQKCEGINE